jgi:hypothetical protein
VAVVVTAGGYDDAGVYYAGPGSAYGECGFRADHTIADEQFDAGRYCGGCGGRDDQQCCVDGSERAGDGWFFRGFESDYYRVGDDDSGHLCLPIESDG